MAPERGRGGPPRKPTRPSSTGTAAAGAANAPRADQVPPSRRRPSSTQGQPSIPGAPAILTDLFRGSLQMVGQVTGIETAARAMERLASSADRAAAILDRVSADRVDHLAEAAERAADILELMDASRLERLVASAERAAGLLDRIDREVGVERVINVLERLERLSETADQMNRSLRAVEKLASDVQKKVIEPFDRLPIPRALRGGLGGGQKPKP